MCKTSSYFFFSPPKKEANMDFKKSKELNKPFPRCKMVSPILSSVANFLQTYHNSRKNHENHL